MSNVTPVDLTHIHYRLAIMWADYTVIIIAITKLRNAEGTTEIAHAFGRIRPLTVLELAQTLAGITTSESDVVSIIRALVLTITGTDSVTGIVKRVTQEQPARLSKDTAVTKQMILDNTVTYVTSTTSTAPTGQTTNAIRGFH